MAFISEDEGVRGRSGGVADASDFRKICLALEGTIEAPHFDRRAFKVKRIYATLAADGKSGTLMLTPDEQMFKMMLAPESFTPVPNAWGRKGATTVTFAKISIKDMGAALEMAWRHAVVARPRRSRR